MAISVFFTLNVPGLVSIVSFIILTQSAAPLEAAALCLSDLCQNGGVCQDMPTDVMCQCPTSLSGPSATGQCEGPDMLCHPVPCLHNATCHPSPADPPGLACRCQSGHTGESCAAGAQQCADSLCGATALCQPLSDRPAGSAPGYSCLCRPGYVGTHCETEVNECASNPCQNRAFCRDEPNGYSCFCIPGFQGRHCEIDVNECASRPCRNGATCLNRVGRFSCLCKVGYTGTRCEVQVDECQSDPCLNGGSCHDYVNGFSCACRAGFLGRVCEVDVDECESDPCQNGAVCTDGVNGYSCDCTGLGFMGPNCDTPVPACMSQPCLNGASCQENQGNYTCYCWLGFEGRNCEVDTNECSSSPCLSGGTCIELSWKALYDTEKLLPAHHDSQNAVGFICTCQPGFEGVLCEEDVNECDLNLCQNGGLCENYPGGYTCHCSQQSQNGRLYGGRNCTVALLGCEGRSCQNGAACLPLLIDGEHSHLCTCPPGFTGRDCQMSTAFSFETGGHLLLQSPATGPLASWNVTLSFRTAMADATLLLLRAGGFAGGFAVQLELAGGRPRLRVLAEGGASPNQEVPCNVSDGEWHAVEVAFEGGALGLRLLGSSCGEEGESTVVVARGSRPREGSGLGAEPPPTFYTVLIGGVGEEGRETPLGDGPLPPFVGCLRDVFVDSRPVVPGDWLSGTPVNVTLGCSTRDRCEDHPCQNRGRCVSQWMSYQCECYRPYDGPDCSEEHVTARFGGEDRESYAVFTLDEAPSEGVDISAFVRTRRQGALLLALANGTGPYLHLWLEEGRPSARARGSSQTLRGGAAVGDGRFHLLGLSVRGDRITLRQSAQGPGSASAPARGVRVRPGDLVYVGGLPDARDSAPFGGYLKGCVQDLRVGARRLQFYWPGGAAESPYGLAQLVNVARGCTGDDACRSNPCLNGGVCYSIWDDFTCTCPPSTTGRRCEEVTWCELSPCPSSAICQPLAHGFECLSNATFLKDGNAVSYKVSGKILRSLTSVSFRVRTRSRNGSILWAKKGLDFLAVSVWDSRLHLELRSGARSLGLSVGSRVAVSDGQWHSVTLAMVTPGSEISQWTVEVDDQGSVSGVAAGNLDFLKEGAELLLGGSGLVGCLSTVDVGGVALPYHGDGELSLPRPQEGRFVRASAGPALLGCWGSPVCEPDPCLNGGYCVDLFDLSRCDCAPGWAGPLCELSSDPCASGPCVHGNCSARAPGHACVCEPGYAGPDCAARGEEADPCQSHLCARGATCLRGYSSYSCLCPPEKTGELCDVKFEQIPWYKENYPRPVLPVSVCGGERWNYTCHNGGNCTRTGSQWACDCMPGFTGRWCETDIDECSSGPCLNKGYCINMINGFHCFCQAYFAGDLCEVQVSDLHIYIFLLLWQNFFQLLSYMILRMDDEPEIDWWFAEE